MWRGLLFQTRTEHSHVSTWDFRFACLEQRVHTSYTIEIDFDKLTSTQGNKYTTGIFIVMSDQEVSKAHTCASFSVEVFPKRPLANTLDP